jgi:hypothetical protein
MEPDLSQIEPDTLALSPQQLERELARTREELQAMQALLEDLPSVFENKFRQRLQPLLEQQQRLLSENTVLRQHLHQLQPGVGAAPQPVLLPQQQERPRLRRALRHAFGLADHSQLDQSQLDRRSAA